MVVGLETFRAHFAGFESQYALIGGVASDILMTRAGLDFRATKDLDIVLCVEALEQAFVAKFHAFIQAGGYRQRERGTTREFYRFFKPTDPAFPAMIELFSRKPDTLVLAETARLTPIVLDEQIASLSAILLDDAYYALLKSGMMVVDGLSIVGAPILIPLKACAYVNLSKSREAGDAIDGKNIVKHRNDVFRLLQLLGPDDRLVLDPRVRADMAAFVERISADETFSPKALGLGQSTPRQQVERLKEAYGL